MDAPRQTSDVLIVGAGAAGLAQACALADALGADAAITVVDRAALGNPVTAAPGSDPRAYALSAGSKRVLDRIGAWAALAPHAQPVTGIDITDSSLNDAFRPRLLGYDNRLEDGEPGTFVVREMHLRAALLAAAAARPGIQLRGGCEVADVTVSDAVAQLTLRDGSALTAPLLIAADGRKSVVRERVGLKIVSWSYPQTGIVTVVKLEKPHQGRAVQHFLPAGPFAILPLPDDHACITWSEETGRAAEILALSDTEFHAELAQRFGHRLGDFEIVAPRASWPLAMHLARGMVTARVALISDAAHGVHPIAGQGLNLGLRDVAALTEVVADAARLGIDVGGLEVLRRYERWRRTDSAMSAVTFDALNRLFSNDWSVLRTLRDAGLGLVDRMPHLKQFFVAEAAGLTGDVPKLLRGEPV
jgi:2-octaprenyl-6-methoxyphenol hydroxylase